MFLSSGYTSAVGNTYFQGLRLSNRIIINFDLGQGYCYLFLNGIRIYGYNGREKQLIASQYYGGSNWKCFSESFARSQCKQMLTQYLQSQCKLMGASAPQYQIEEFAGKMVDETINNNQVETIKRLQ
jgi:hypothetical protein